MDDKGLVAIFCFGLPGFVHDNHALHATRAALHIAKVMKAGGEPCTAGVTTGDCFCGFIGDVNRRSEYSVVGGKRRLPHIMSPTGLYLTLFR
eukprot:scaffold674380_cov57-Prasinocladus_malaysianus.AAC.1